VQNVLRILNSENDSYFLKDLLDFGLFLILPFVSIVYKRHSQGIISQLGWHCHHSIPFHISLFFNCHRSIAFHISLFFNISLFKTNAHTSWATALDELVVFSKVYRKIALKCILFLKIPSSFSFSLITTSNRFCFWNYVSSYSGNFL